jgi:hypothetical protein
MNISRPARLLAVLGDAELVAACLIELMVSPPALARPMTLAFDACACSRKDEKSARERVADLAQHLAAVGLDHVASVSRSSAWPKA